MRTNSRASANWKAEEDSKGAGGGGLPGSPPSHDLVLGVSGLPDVLGHESHLGESNVTALGRRSGRL